MDSPTPSRQSAFSARNSSVDVSQLDKINAIPNKTADKVLLSNLCPEDQHYLKFLMENDPSSDSDDDLEPARHRSSGAWSPMVQSPMMNKRKGMKPSYAVTLSLEDISYIRPSWGISKGIRTIEVDGKKSRKKLEKSESIKDLPDKNDKAKKGETIAYKYFLLILTLVVIFLTLPPYLAERKKYNDQINQHRLKVSKKLRTLEIYRPDGSEQTLSDLSILKVDFGLGLPFNLKPEECTCALYDAELKKYTDVDDENREKVPEYCFTCLDWAVRANFRVLVDHKSATDICYGVKWQSYDSLATPLIDCFIVEKNNQWFGLGDLHSPGWDLDKLQIDWIPLATNLTAESIAQSTPSQVSSSSFGSYANFTLFSTSGIFIGNLRSDFRLSIKVELTGSSRRICIRANCSDKCSRVWSRADDLGAFRLSNNVLEYQICSSTDVKNLITHNVDQRVRSLDGLVRKHLRDLVGEPLDGNQTIIYHEKSRSNNSALSSVVQFERLLERESHLANWQQPTTSSDRIVPVEKLNTSNLLPESIGLIERVIFATSPEFMPVFDGKTLRQYVDGVVKMGLRTSPILLIDSRWETYTGSLQIDTALFPKWRLLFEIIHNKGFKVLLTVKPYMDTVIGAASINQLHEEGKLYGISLGINRAEQDVRGKATIIRRKSLFSIQNDTIEIGQNGSATNRPFVFKCKESQVGYCALFELQSRQTRAWLINQIARSELLGSGAADGILLAGSHPDSFSWEDHYREGLGELVHDLFFGERIFTLPKWSGNLGCIQLASRLFTWDGLRSMLNSVLNLSLEGFSLIHPGSVWGDLRPSSQIGNISSTTADTMAAGLSNRAQVRKGTIYLEDVQARERSDEELSIRWLQVSIFLPILQFNNLAPIERYGLQDLLQNLVKIRKIHIIAELKRNLPFTPLISQSRFNSSGPMIGPLIRPVWFNQQHVSAETPDTVVAEQFSIGSDILVAPILSEAVRQRDIYLPSGFWHDELRQMNLRGGKWLRNYPIELNEVAWFTRVKR